MPGSGRAPGPVQAWDRLSPQGRPCAMAAEAALMDPARVSGGCPAALALLLPIKERGMPWTLLRPFLCHPNPKVPFPGQGLRGKVISGIQWVRVWNAVSGMGTGICTFGDEAGMGMFRELQVCVRAGGQELGL